MQSNQQQDNDNERRYWKREYRVVFPDINLEYNNLQNCEGLKVSFDISKDLTQDTNKCSLKIYNLTAESRKKIEVADLVVEVYAGYRDNGNPKKIFRGSVVSGVSESDGTDVVTELKLSDGQTAVRDSWFAISFPPGTSGNTILKAIADNMGLDLVFGEGVTFGTFANGFSYGGKGADMLNSICYGSGCTWSIQNGVLSVILAGGTTTTRGIVFSPSSGLLGSPKRIIRADHKADKDTEKKTRRKKEKKEKPDKKAGWKIETLLSPTVSPGDAVKVESKRITGWFRVESAKHSGDVTDTWNSEFELIEGLVDDGTK